MSHAAFDDAHQAGHEANQGRAAGSDPEPVRVYRGAGIMWGAIGLLVLLAAFVIVVLQNSHSVSFEFLWLEAETPLALIIAVSVAASLAVGEVIGWSWRRHRRSDLQRREELRRLTQSS